MKIETLIEQEKELQLDRFDNDTVLDIGLRIMNEARVRKFPVAIDITRCRQSLFHVLLPGATSDNDEWLSKKINAVYRFEKSSLHMELMLRQNNDSIENVFHVSSSEYAASGGSFPVRVKNTGVVGTISVSGLASEEDHALITEVLREYCYE